RQADRPRLHRVVQLGVAAFGISCAKFEICARLVCLCKSMAMKVILWLSRMCSRCLPYTEGNQVYSLISWEPCLSVVHGPLDRPPKYELACPPAAAAAAAASFRDGWLEVTPPCSAAAEAASSTREHRRTA
ncbi:unnamed protein product, partial [Sphagnum tenellum]